MAAAWCNSFYVQVFLLVLVLEPIIIRDGSIQVLEMISYWRIARGQFVHPSCLFMSCWLRHRQQEKQQQHWGKDQSLCSHAMEDGNMESGEAAPNRALDTSED